MAQRASAWRRSGNRIQQEAAVLKLYWSGGAAAALMPKVRAYCGGARAPHGVADRSRAGRSGGWVDIVTRDPFMHNGMLPCTSLLCASLTLFVILQSHHFVIIHFLYSYLIFVLFLEYGVRMCSPSSLIDAFILQPLVVGFCVGIDSAEVISSTSCHGTIEC